MLGNALEKEEFDQLTDPRLGTNYIDSEMFQMIEIAAACVRHSAAKRPGMGQVKIHLLYLKTNPQTTSNLP